MYYGLISSMKKTVAASYTARTTAFASATGITDTTILGALNTMDLSLISAGLDTKMKALYPFVGGTASTHKYNFMDARDLDAAFRLTFSGGWTHANTGATPNGTNGYANTFLTPSGNIGQNDSHISYYSRTQSTTGAVDIRASNSGNQHVLDIEIYFGGRYYTNNCGYASSSAITTTTGLFTCNRISSTQYKGFRNTTIEQTNNITSTGLSNKNIYIGAGNSGDTAAWFSVRECAFASIGTGMSDAEQTIFYTITQTFQTSLARQVGVPIVSDSNAQAFLDAAVITDVTQANAVNQLVIDLKAASIWTKMKAVYPFVGGTASTHKFNLVNPVDSDAAFRLTFNGGWTHSSTGAKPNGTNAYADSFFIPLINNIANSSHLSYYSRTLVSESKIDIGCYGVVAGSDYNQIAISFGGTTYCNPNNGGGAVGVTFSSNSQGFFIASRTSATNVFGQRNAVQTTGTSATARNENSIYLGALHQGVSTSYYATKECAFSSIGDSLSTSEALAFNLAVTNFQTSLSRNV